MSDFDTMLDAMKADAIRCNRRMRGMQAEPLPLDNRHYPSEAATRKKVERLVYLVKRDKSATARKRRNREWAAMADAGYTYRDIAKLSGVSVGAVANGIHAGRRG